MISHTQTILHDPHRKPGEPVGDCLRTCVACLLDLPVESVPHFVDAQVNGGSDWRLEMFAWLEPMGLSVVEIDLSSTGPAAYGEAWLWIDRGGRCIISGISPRSIDEANPTYHAVIGEGGEITHDPHPSRGGLAGSADQWKYMFLVRKF
jgi:hypothetical protein